MITEKEGTSQKSSHKWLNEFYSPRRSESGWIKINSRESLKCTPQMSGQEKSVPHTASTVQNRLASNIPNAAESLVRVDLVWLLLVLGMGLKDGLGETSAFKLVVTSDIRKSMASKLKILWRRENNLERQCGVVHQLWWKRFGGQTSPVFISSLERGSKTPIGILRRGTWCVEGRKISGEPDYQDLWGEFERPGKQSLRPRLFVEDNIL